jgi:quercetin dioxygenase-like cupin family protein
MIASRNVEVAAVAVKAVEGKPMYGGDMLVKPLMKGDEMTFLEIHYAAGVGAPLHAHTHESIAYIVKGDANTLTVARKVLNLSNGTEPVTRIGVEELTTP